MKTTSRAIRTCNLELYISPEAKQILSAAALLAKFFVNQFVLESALKRAAETLSERQHFHLNAEQWEAFIAALEEPHRTVPQLQKLFSEPSPFDIPETK